MNVEIIEDPVAFRALGAEWSELLAASPVDGLFLTWEWLSTWWSHFGQGRRLKVITLRRSGRLAGVAPLAMRQAGLRQVPPVATLEILGSGTIGSDYLDLIVRRDCEREAAERLGDALSAQSQTIGLRRLRPEGTGWRTAAAALRRHGWSCEARAGEGCPVVRLPASFEGFLETLGASHRANFRRRLRRLEQRFTVRFAAVTTDAERQRALATLIELHEKRWRQRGGPGAFAGAAERAFHDEITRLALQRGWLRLFVLSLDDRPAAALYGFRYGRTFYFYQSGFDPQLAAEGVGLVTMGLAIRSAVEEGLDEFDLLHGHEAYKALWANDQRILWDLIAYPPGLNGALCRGATSLRRVAGRVWRQARAAHAPTAGITLAQP